jgi:hypothetical protein
VVKESALGSQWRRVTTTAELRLARRTPTSRKDREKWGTLLLRTDN